MLKNIAKREDMMCINDSDINSSEVNLKHEWFRLTKQRARLLLIYLSSITILSFAALILILVKEISPFSTLSIFSVSLISSIITSLLGSSICYSRKLYKSCINQDMLTPQNDDDKIKQLGVTSYYLSRPLYSACLSLISCIAIRSGTEFISLGGVLNEKYIYLVML